MIYGPLSGALLISPIGAVAAALVFVIGRAVGRPRVRTRLTRYPQLAAVDAVLAGRGLRAVMLLRLASVVPFAPLSYGLGVSRMSGWDFVLASWLGLLSGTFLYAYIGSLASRSATS